MELKGKIIDFLGDSITEGVGVCDQNNRYDNVAHRRLGLAAHYNYGIGGTRLAHQSAPSETPRYDLCFCGRAYLLEKSADLIVVYGGVNDYIHGDAYFGKMEDRTPETFCGALNILIAGLTEKYPRARILFMTNYNRWPTKNKLGLSDIDYVEAMKQVCAVWSIPCFDNYHNCGISFQNPAHAAWMDEGLVRGDEKPNRHFSAEAYEWLSYKYEAILASI